MKTRTLAKTRTLSLALFTLLTPLLAPARAVGVGERAPDFIAGGQWFNTPAPIHISQLRGRVVLVNFWVYSCINCHLSLPTLQTWNRRYHAAGLDIIGVHTPEFGSDRPAPSVAASIREDGVGWPVVQDNDNATWNAYGVEAWPGFYLVDRRGVVRSVSFGELSSRYPGAIPGLEATIQKLLAEK